MSVIIETTTGDLIVDLYTEERPKSCCNFLKLCKLKYYNFCHFHCIQENFVAQTGDPTASGEGGSCVTGVIGNGDEPRFFDMEVVPKIAHTKVGQIAMVNNGLGQHGSQFLFTLAPALDSLDGKHTVFGEVAESEGFEVLEKLSGTFCDREGRPFQDILITHTIILEDPYPDPPGLIVPSRSPSPPVMDTDGLRIRADEELDEFQGLNQDEIKDRVEKKTTLTNLKLLEVIGDIRDSEELPPENVLFVCKLHPRTSSEDLGVIFSKFGSVIATEIICDQKTGDSLCYGFVEFEKVDDCSNAYFKMDNVLIDDRRIHVDFCQSLAKKASRRYMGTESQEEASEVKEQYGLVFDNLELLQQAMRKKAKEARNRKRKERQSGDDRNSRKRRCEFSSDGSLSSSHRSDERSKQSRHSGRDSRSHHASRRSPQEHSIPQKHSHSHSHRDSTRSTHHRSRHDHK